jgi:hypothetical protein
MIFAGSVLLRFTVGRCTAPVGSKKRLAGLIDHVRTAFQPHADGASQDVDERWSAVVMLRNLAAWWQLGNLNGERLARNIGELLPPNDGDRPGLGGTGVRCLGSRLSVRGRAMLYHDHCSFPSA